MGVDMAAAGIGPDLTRANHLGFLLLVVPVVFDTLGLGLGDMNHATVLGR